jgi:hypothetical protein
VQVFKTWWPGLVAYILGAIGVTLIATQLSAVVLVHAIVLARPYLEGSPPKLSLIQQRQLDAALALPPSPNPITSPVVPSQAPNMRPGVLAAQLDISEQQDSAKALPQVASVELRSEPSTIATEATKFRIAHSHPRYPRLTAADIFNRSFGVITVAAN